MAVFGMRGYVHQIDCESKRAERFAHRPFILCLSETVCGVLFFDRDLRRAYAYARRTFDFISLDWSNFVQTSGFVSFEARSGTCIEMIGSFRVSVVGSVGIPWDSMNRRPS